MGVSGRVAAGAVWAWDPNFGNGPFSWYMGGGYTVTATAVPSPFQVTESAPDADGFVTYTAEALYGLEFLNPTEFYWNPPAGAATWRFFPGDSLGDKPDLSGRGLEVNQCAQLLVCRYKPPKAGRMQVRAYVETQNAVVRSKPAGQEPCSSATRAMAECAPTEQQPKLVLACSPSTAVTRGDSVTCVATAEPQGAVRTELVWKFVSAPIAGDSFPHEVPGPTGTDTLWAGTIVVPGVITVSGRVNGSPSTDSARITVNPRKWPRIGLTVRQDGHGDLPPTPTYEGELAHTHFDTLSASSLPVREIWNGPNSGWAFFHSPIQRFGLLVHVSDVWKAGSPWRKLQHYGIYTDPITHLQHAYCTNAQIPANLQPSLQHEGLIPGLFPSHVDLYRDWFNNNAPQDTLEAATVYMPDFGGAGSAATWLLNYNIARLENDATSDPAQKDGTPQGKVALAPWNCKPRF